MVDPKKDNYRVVPAFNFEFATLVDCVTSAIIEFTKRPALPFLIMHYDARDFWLVLPLSQYRSAPADHPCHSSTVIFNGNLFALRDLAYSFPPDLFSDTIFNLPDHRLAETVQPNEIAPPAPRDSGNGSDPTLEHETLH